ncbi:MAG: hypothetical protein LPK85_03205, partial [Gammaproteobacteria bacterium]|nr:hypothetical protein [Gammaproteobacteria bacterium]
VLIGGGVAGALLVAGLVAVLSRDPQPLPDPAVDQVSGTAAVSAESPGATTFAPAPVNPQAGPLTTIPQDPMDTPASLHQLLQEEVAERQSQGIRVTELEDQLRAQNQLLRNLQQRAADADVAYAEVSQNLAALQAEYRNMTGRFSFVMDQLDATRRRLDALERDAMARRTRQEGAGVAAPSRRLPEMRVLELEYLGGQARATLTYNGEVRTVRDGDVIDGFRIAISGDVVKAHPMAAGEVL